MDRGQRTDECRIKLWMSRGKEGAIKEDGGIKGRQRERGIK